MTLTVAAPCSGYGGLETAIARLLPAELAWVADNDTGPSKLIAHRRPGVPNLGDITKLDWRMVPRVDVWGTGFPCTDVSLAGPRGGMLHGNRSGVWFHIAEGIQAARPWLIFIENTEGLLYARADSNMESCPGCLGNGSDERAMRALGAVLGDLASLGFDAEWCRVPASGTGACHERKRVFVLAWDRAAADADGAAGRQWRLAAARQASGWRAWADSRGHRGVVAAGRMPAADAGRVGLEGLRGDPGAEPGRTAADQGGHGPAGSDPGVSRPWDWREYAAAVARQEQAYGRPAPRPVAPGRTGERLAPVFVEWMQGLDEGWVTAVPGLSRKEQLMLLGNGVVPAQATWAFAHLLQAMAAATGVPAPGRRAA